MSMSLKKVFGVFSAAAMLMAVMVFVLKPVEVLAAGASSVSASSSDSGSSSSSEPVASGSIEIVSYETLPDVISKNMAVNFVVTLRDTRHDVVNAFQINGTVNPVPQINSITFVPSSAPHVEANSVSSDGTSVYYRIIAPTTYSGYGKSFQCDISYQDVYNVPLTQVSLTVNQAVEWQEPSSSSSSDSSTSVRGTNFVVRSSSYGQSSVAAGTPFTFSIEAMTTNGSYAVENITASLTLPKELAFASGTSTVYVGTAQPNAVFNASFQLLAGANTAEGSYTINLSIRGINAKTGDPVEDKVDFTIPVYQPERFEILNSTVPDYLNAGMEDMGYGSITVINKGIGEVHNVTVTVAGGDLYFLDGDVYIGAVKGNSQSNTDFTLMSNTPGVYDAVILVEYENARGEAKTLEHKFTVTVAEGGGEMPIDPGMIEPMPEENTGPGKLPFIIGGAVVVAGGVITGVLVHRRRKKKRDAALNDDYEDSEE